MKGRVVVVNYNQSVEIPDFLKALKASYPIEDVIVVDDGSTDGSAEIASELGFHVVRHPENRGVGAAIRTGLLDSKKRGTYDHVIIMASSGKMLPSEIASVQAPLIANTADYVQGSRYLNGTRSPGLTVFRTITIPIFTMLGSFLLKHRHTDLTCGFRAYKLSILDDPAIDISQSWLDYQELEYYLHYKVIQQGYRMVEAPVTMRYVHLNKKRRTHIIPFLGWWRMVRPFILLSLRIKN